MRLSKYFLPVSKEAPSDAAIVSHQLMLRTGMVRQNGAGIYTWLPLGLRVLKKIEQIVREEMNRAGAVEILMPTLQRPICGANLVATKRMARKCFASQTDMIAICFSGRRMRNWSQTCSAPT